MNIRIYNAKILTMCEDQPLFDGELWVNDDKIDYIGPPKPHAGRWARQIDARGCLLLPGFKNAHAHAPMTFLRSLADDLPLPAWLTRVVFPAEARLTPDDVYLFTKLAILEYLSSGITAAFDMYRFAGAVAQAAVDCGFRMVLCGTVHASLSSVAEMEDDYRRLNRLHPLVSYRLGFHAEYTCNEPLLRDVAALAHCLKAPVFAHNSETAQEVQACKARYGVTPTALFDRLGLFDFGGGGFHCVHLSREDYSIFQTRSLYAVTNPGSNCKLASGIAPLEALRRRGIPIAIGTDGPASNNALDMFREMYLATALQKLACRDAAALPAEDVLHMATCNGARAMGLVTCDCIKKGNSADIILLDLRQPNMQPAHNIVKNIVYSGSKANVKLTMVAGRILYENGGFHTGFDQDALYAQANARLKQLLAE